MMNLLHITFILVINVLLIRSEEIDDLNCDEPIINNNSSNALEENTNDEATGEDAVVFKAFNRKHSDGVYISLNTSESDLKTILLAKLSTTFLTHGWLGSENGSYVLQVVEAYLQTRDINVIVAGWSKISRNPYSVAARGVTRVGTTVGRMVSYLLDLGLIELNRTHLLGHSLGAHIMGIAGRSIQQSGHGKVARITGLDPAGPGFEHVSDESVRLDKEDGQFVDIMHTSAGLFGFKEAIGHADFYPNGGFNFQPGCTFTLNIFCSHIKAVLYFVESIYNEHAFPSVKCDSFLRFALHQCESSEVVFMGLPTPSSARGTFYLNTFSNRTMDEDYGDIPQ